MDFALYLQDDAYMFPENGSNHGLTLDTLQQSVGQFSPSRLNAWGDRYGRVLGLELPTIMAARSFIDNTLLRWNKGSLYQRDMD
jgi:hypothetical protein